jgi:hypothetical protein
MILAGMSFGMFACSKDYTCSCTTRESRISATLNELTTIQSITVVKNVSRRYVREEMECYSTKQTTVVNDYLVGTDGNGQPMYEDVTITTDKECDIN